ncbi:MAG: hypothetical protein HFG35_14195 [Eubacterium sp.]|jgi:hypothetical protein|nr:hypothetical protein [Eubacterium sp.]
MAKDRNVNIIEDTDGKKIVVIHDIKFKAPLYNFINNIPDAESVVLKP